MGYKGCSTPQLSSWARFFSNIFRFAFFIMTFPLSVALPEKTVVPFLPGSAPWPYYSENSSDNTENTSTCVCESIFPSRLTNLILSTVRIWSMTTCASLP